MRKEAQERTAEDDSRVRGFGGRGVVGEKVAGWASGDEWTAFAARRELPTN